MSDDAATRAAARRSWPIHKFRLGEEPSDDLSGTTTVSERVAMVWQMTKDSWSSAGRTIPDYLRRETPIQVIDRRLNRS